MDAKGTFKRICFLCEELIQSKTPDFIQGRLYDRVKLFYTQCKIGDFHKDFNIQFFFSYYKILRKHHVARVRHKLFGSTLGDISTRSYFSKRFSFEPNGQLQDELFDENRTLSVEGFCLDCFRKTVNVSSFYENCGGDVHQSNDTVKEFHLHVSDSKMQNSATTTAQLYTLLAKLFEKNK